MNMPVSQEVEEKILRKLKGEDAEEIAIFGSYTRAEEEPGSDIDILVSFSQLKSLFEIVRIEREFSEDIGIKVDLVTEKSLSPYIRNEVEREKRVIA